jgi:TPR repeat protein
MTTREQNQLYQQSLDLLLGHGVPKDESRAFAVNAEAAHQGHADAVLAMGWFYLNGVGVPVNTEEATKWYRDSARRGEPRAMFSLGQIAYNSGDFADALNWFTRAANAGHARSLYWLGKLRWRGHGTGEDRPEAIQYFFRAAGLKVKEAARFLRWRSSLEADERKSERGESEN